MKATFLLPLLIFCISCSNKFYVPENQIKNNVDKIGLIWLSLPEELNYRSKNLEKLINKTTTQNLNDGGFNVIPFETVDRIYKEVKSELGSLYDVNTGKLDKHQLLKIKKETFLRLKNLYDVDSILYQEISVVSAPFMGQWANWNDSSESVYEEERHLVEDLLIALFVQESGHIPALTYCASLVDRNNEYLYSGCAGLELVSKIRKIKVTDHASSNEECDYDEISCEATENEKNFEYKTDFVSIPVDKVLRDENKIKLAITKSLNELVEIKGD